MYVRNNTKSFPSVLKCAVRDSLNASGNPETKRYVICGAHKVNTSFFIGEQAIPEYRLLQTKYRFVSAIYPNH